MPSATSPYGGGVLAAGRWGSASCGGGRDGELVDVPGGVAHLLERAGQAGEAGRRLVERDDRAPVGAADPQLDRLGVEGDQAEVAGAVDEVAAAVVEDEEEAARELREGRGRADAFVELGGHRAEVCSAAVEAGQR